MTNAEIQVGEYVRSNTGYISKLVKKHNEENRYEEMWQFETTITQRYGQCSNYLMPIYNEAKSHSFNIIDLIEAGDYINGMEVAEFDDDETGELYLGFPIFADSLMNCIEEVRPLSTVEIKSVVTHQQFKDIEYKVGRGDD